jgi:hypothetical protein
MTLAAWIKRRHADRVLDYRVIGEERKPAGLVLGPDIPHRVLSSPARRMLTDPRFHLYSPLEIRHSK